MEVAGRMQRRAVAKVSALHGNVRQNGEGAAASFLDRGFLCRLALLLPAVHNWLKVRQMSVLIPYSVRVALIAMKVISAEAMGALFFASSAPTPDSDPKCSPPSDGFERLVQSVTVGFVTAFLSDGIIFILFMWQSKRVVRRTEWTETSKSWKRFWWSFRTRAFWLISFLYTIACQIYTFLFLANVRQEDAATWLESIAWTLFQDVLLKPFLVAVILTTLSSVMLCCRPSLKRKIQQAWKEGVDEGDEGNEGDTGEQNHSDPEPEESHVNVSNISSEPELAEEEPVGSDAKVVADGGTSNQKGFQGILPGMIAQT